jgi:hypothetical protein
MSYLMSDLIKDILPRVGRTGNPNGISIWQAANSIQSLVYKRLLDKRSDLMATGDLSLSIPALGYSAALPDGFVSMAEKPRCVDILTDWMAGTVTSYNSVTGALVANITESLGDGDVVATWCIALGALPGQAASTIGTSATSLTVGAGAQSLTITTGLTLSAGDYIIISSSALPSDWEMRDRQVQPAYLDDDEYHHEYTWWEWYGVYGATYEPPSIRPRRYKIIGTTFYVRPKVTVNVMITGKYNAKPTVLSTASQPIPWNSFFDEVFRAGVVRIIQKGIEIPDADPDFMVFFNREVNVLLNSRANLVPATRRIKRGNYM